MKYSKEDLIEALVGADSIREVMTKLGLKINSGNYRVVRKYYLEADVPFPETFPREASRTHAPQNRIPDSGYFAYGVYRSGSALRKRLIGLGEDYRCSMCGMEPQWMGQSLTLQVDHIDGNSFNNLRANLRFLCPNCHSQTDTYGNNGLRSLKKYSYCECGTRIMHTSERCKTCSNRSRAGSTVLDWPPLQDVIDLVNSASFSQAGRVLGRSDNAIRKFLRRHGVDVMQRPLKIPDHPDFTIQQW